MNTFAFIYFVLFVSAFNLSSSTPVFQIKLPDFFSFGRRATPQAHEYYRTTEYVQETTTESRILVEQDTSLRSTIKPNPVLYTEEPLTSSTSSTTESLKDLGNPTYSTSSDIYSPEDKTTQAPVPVPVGGGKAIINAPQRGCEAGKKLDGKGQCRSVF